MRGKDDAIKNQSSNFIRSFIQVLLDIMKNDESVHWNANGNTVVIENKDFFKSRVLSAYYHHSSLQVFLEQARSYGFAIGTSRVKQERCYLQHSCFTVSSPLYCSCMNPRSRTKTTSKNMLENCRKNRQRRVFKCSNGVSNSSNDDGLMNSSSDSGIEENDVMELNVPIKRSIISTSCDEPNIKRSCVDLKSKDPFLDSVLQVRQLQQQILSQVEQVAKLTNLERVLEGGANKTFSISDFVKPSDVAMSMKTTRKILTTNHSSGPLPSISFLQKNLTTQPTYRSLTQKVE